MYAAALTLALLPLSLAAGTVTVHRGDLAEPTSSAAPTTLSTMVRAVSSSAPTPTPIPMAGSMMYFTCPNMSALTGVCGMDPGNMTKTVAQGMDPAVKSAVGEIELN